MTNLSRITKKDPKGEDDDELPFNPPKDLANTPINHFGGIAWRYACTNTNNETIFTLRRIGEILWGHEGHFESKSRQSSGIRYQKPPHPHLRHCGRGEEGGGDLSAGRLPFL